MRQAAESREHSSSSCSSSSRGQSGVRMVHTQKQHKEKKNHEQMAQHSAAPHMLKCRKTLFAADSLTAMYHTFVCCRCCCCCRSTTACTHIVGANMYGSILGICMHRYTLFGTALAPVPTIGQIIQLRASTKPMLPRVEIDIYTIAHVVFACTDVAPLSH
jgi:hypothetical protein